MMFSDRIAKDNSRTAIAISPIFGYTGSTFWLKFTVRTKGSDPGEMLLEFDWPTPMKSNFMFFIKEPGGNYIITLKKLAGRTMPMADWEIRHRNFLFNFPLDSLNTQYVFMKLKTDDSLRAPLTLWQKRPSGNMQKTNTV